MTRLTLIAMWSRDPAAGLLLEIPVNLSKRPVRWLLQLLGVLP